MVNKDDLITYTNQEIEEITKQQHEEILALKAELKSYKDKYGEIEKEQKRQKFFKLREKNRKLRLKKIKKTKQKKLRKCPVCKGMFKPEKKLQIFCSRTCYRNREEKNKGALKK